MNIQGVASGDPMLLWMQDSFNKGAFPIGSQVYSKFKTGPNSLLGRVVNHQHGRVVIQGTDGMVTDYPPDELSDERTQHTQHHPPPHAVRQHHQPPLGALSPSQPQQGASHPHPPHFADHRADAFDAPTPPTAPYQRDTFRNGSYVQHSRDLPSQPQPRVSFTDAHRSVSPARSPTGRPLLSRDHATPQTRSMPLPFTPPSQHHGRTHGLLQAAPTAIVNKKCPLCGHEVSDGGGGGGGGGGAGSSIPPSSRIPTVESERDDESRCTTEAPMQSMASTYKVSESEHNGRTIVEIERRVEVPVEKIVEVEVERIVEVPVEKIVEKIVEVEVEKIVEKIVERIVEVPAPVQTVEKEVEVEVIRELVKEVPVHTLKEVEKLVEVPIEVVRIQEVERRVEVPVEVEKQVPMQLIREVEVPKLVEVEKRVEVPIYHTKLDVVEKIVEIPFERTKLVEKIMEKEKIVEVPIESTKIVEVIKTVEIPVEITKIVEVERIVEVPIEITKIVEVPVERVVVVEKEVERIIEVPKVVNVDRVVEVPKMVEVPKIVEVERYIEKEVQSDTAVKALADKDAEVAELRSILGKLSAEVRVMVEEKDGTISTLNERVSRLENVRDLLASELRREKEATAATTVRASQAMDVVMQERSAAEASAVISAQAAMQAAAAANSLAEASSPRAYISLSGGGRSGPIQTQKDLSPARFRG